MRWLLGFAGLVVVLAGLYWMDTTPSDRAYHARLFTGSGVPEPSGPDYRDELAR